LESRGGHGKLAASRQPWSPSSARGGDTSGGAGARGRVVPGARAPRRATRGDPVHFTTGGALAGGLARPAPGAGHVPTPLVSRASYSHSARPLLLPRLGCRLLPLPGRRPVALSTVPSFPRLENSTPSLLTCRVNLLIYLAVSVGMLMEML